MWISVRADHKTKEIAEKVAKFRGKTQSATMRELLLEEAARIGISVPGGAEA